MNWEHLERGSSPVDWCEGNYLISKDIAEFVNTISNVLFFVLPPLLIHLFNSYGKLINPAIHLVWVLLIVVGLSSAYFHATLSLIGQLLDEVSIIWVFMAGFTLFYPSRYLPNKCTRTKFKWAMGFVTTAATGLSFWHPAANAFVMMFLAVPAVWLLIQEIKKEKCPRVRRLGVRCTVIWVVAVLCWVNDRLFCDTWSSINFPYLHGCWHIFIFIASYTACVLFAYFTVKNENLDRLAFLKYWPKNEWELGIPFVAIKSDYKNLDDQI